MKKKINPKKIKFLEKIIDEVITNSSHYRGSATYHSEPMWGWGKEESNERKRSDRCDRESLSKDDEEIQPDNG
tara:strand:+ start:1171 stop:1389 length:219 start_codon:yes stop_codon:yes gene_type:complete